MAVTKIWSIKYSLDDVVKYVANPKKIIKSDLFDAIHYAANGEKIVADGEHVEYVTGVNCDTKTAFEEMYCVKKKFNKPGGNVAYHAYQSFKTGEVTPEQCHSIGVETAKQMWGTDYQVLVATHFNTGTYHNHFVINSVGLWDGKKFNCNKNAYYKFRDISDKLCYENKLTVIENPTKRTPRPIYLAEKRGEPTKYNLMREAIDKAISYSYDYKQFIYVMKTQGYIIQDGCRIKHPTIRSVNDTRNTRMYRLGAGYNADDIKARILRNSNKYNAKFYQYQKAYESRKPKEPIQYTLRDSIFKVKKIKGLRALYFHYCYRLGYLPKKNQHRPKSPEMREASRHIDRYSQEVRLVTKHKIDTFDDLNVLIEKNTQLLAQLEKTRQQYRNKQYRCTNPDELKERREKCYGYTEVMKGLRDEIRVANHIIEDTPKIERNIQVEVNMRNIINAELQRKKTRDYYER